MREPLLNLSPSAANEAKSTTCLCAPARMAAHREGGCA
jgi:hypothetical protein